MKKNVFFFLTLLSLAFMARAYDFSAVAPTGQTLFYSFINSETEVSVVGSSTNISGNLEIPSAVNYSGTTYPVTSIGYAAFEDCSSLTHVTIPNTVTNIGDSAFSYCSGMTGPLTIPESVTSIGLSAFGNCTGITTVFFNASNCSYMGYETNPVFFACNNLTSVIIGENVTIIPGHAFAWCRGLTDVNIPNSVTSIGESAFHGCTGLTSVTIPNSVTSIGSAAFYSCTSLTSITIPNSVTSIENYAFYRCGRLTSVTIPNSVTSIGSYAFCDCKTLTNVTIPNLVTSIGYSAFYGCTGLTSVTIPNSVTSIGDRAFKNCIGLTSVTIPNSVTSIVSSAFAGCIGLTSVTIPNSVTSIGDYAFAGCSGLTGVTIPNSVTSIGDYAFQYCSGLTSVRMLSSNPPSLGGSVFANTQISKVVEIPCGTLASYQQAWGTSYNYSEGFVDYTLTLQSNNNDWGSVSFVQQNGHDISCDGYAIFSATANDGYHFVSWNDGNTSNPRHLLVTEDVTYTAQFAPDSYEITATANVASMGSVTGGGNYDHGTAVTLTATAAPCHHFVAWSNGETTESITFTASENVTLTATFARDADQHSYEQVTSCMPYTWEVNGKTYNKSGVKTFKGTTAEGCVTRDTLELTIIKGHSNVVEATSCLPYYWDVTGRTYNKSGVKTFKSSQPDADGCYTYDTLRLNIIKGYSNTAEVTSCLPYYWDVTGRTYNKSGVKTFKSSQPDADGCYTYDTLRLNIIKGYSNTVEVTSCVPYTWDVTGKTYNKSGVKTYKTPAGEDGCAFYDTLRLNIVKGYSHHEYVENCGPYYWDVTGKTYNKSGMKTYKSAPDADGCSTYDTLYLVVLNCDKSPDDNSQLSTLNSQLSIYPNPTTGLVHIDVKAGSENNFNSQLSTFNLTVEVLDLVGRRVAVYENTNSLDLSNLADGTYTLRITLPEGVTLRKVVKR